MKNQLKTKFKQTTIQLKTRLKAPQTNLNKVKQSCFFPVPVWSPGFSPCHYLYLLDACSGESQGDSTPTRCPSFVAALFSRSAPVHLRHTKAIDNRVQFCNTMDNTVTDGDARAVAKRSGNESMRMNLKI